MTARPPSWDFRRATLAAHGVARVGVENGLTPAACLAGTGITPSQLDDPEAEIEADQELRLVRNLLAGLGDRPGLGMAAGSRLTLASSGLLGFAMLASLTVRDAIVVAVRFLGLTYTFQQLLLEESGDEAQLICNDDDVPDDVRAFLLERDLTVLATQLPTLLGPALMQRYHGARLDVRLDDERGSVFTELLSFFDARFGRPRTILAFPRTMLDEPLPQADEHTARMCERQCADLLQRRRQRKGLAQVVRARILRDPGDLPSMQAVAAEQHIGVRTLRRRLAAEGTSFRALTDEVREAVAVELLAHVGLSVEEVAQRLGYAETSGFTHAFIRWHGVPPSRFRHRGAERLGRQLR